MSKNNDFGNAEEEFRARKSSTTILHALHNVIHVFKVFSDKSMYSGVFRNGFKGSNVLYVVRFGSFDRYIVDIENGDMWNFGLQDIGDIVVEYRDRIGPTHRKSNESKHAKGGLKHCIIMRGFCNKSLVVSDK